MNIVAGLLFLLFFASCSSIPVRPATDTKLYPIRHGDRWGYIDANGTEVIPTRFRAVDKFSEGLAPARLGGRYGYIDSTGEFAIPPQFDYALPFINGTAKVFINRRPMPLSREDGTTADIPPIEYGWYETVDNYTIIVTPTTLLCHKRYGIIDRAGRLAVDTAFRNIIPCGRGAFIVVGFGHSYLSARKGDPSEIGVVDTTGKWLVPYGRYYDLKPRGEGYIEAYLFREPGQEFAIDLLDAKGNTVFTRSVDSWSFPDIRQNIPHGFHCGLAEVRIGTGRGVVDASGTILMQNATWRTVVPFCSTAVFVQSATTDWILLDTDGRQKSEYVFDDIFVGIGAPHNEEVFSRGLAFVHTAAGYAAIDTNGTIIAGREPLPPVRIGPLPGLNAKGTIFFSWHRAIPCNMASGMCVPVAL